MERNELLYAGVIIAKCLDSNSIHHRDTELQSLTVRFTIIKCDTSCESGQTRELKGPLGRWVKSGKITLQDKVQVQPGRS